MKISCENFLELWGEGHQEDIQSHAEKCAKCQTLLNELEKGLHEIERPLTKSEEEEMQQILVEDREWLSLLIKADTKFSPIISANEEEANAIKEFIGYFTDSPTETPMPDVDDSSISQEDYLYSAMKSAPKEKTKTEDEFVLQRAIELVSLENPEITLRIEKIKQQDACYVLFSLFKKGNPFWDWEDTCISMNRKSVGCLENGNLKKKIEKDFPLEQFKYFENLVILIRHGQQYSYFKYKGNQND